MFLSETLTRMRFHIAPHKYNRTQDGITIVIIVKIGQMIRYLAKLLTLHSFKMTTNP